MPFFTEYRKLRESLGPDAFMARAMLDWGTKGEEERLVAAAEAMKDYGELAIPILLKYRDRAEMAYFLTTFAGMKGVVKSEREVAIRTFLDHANPAIGHAAVDALADLRSQKTNVL